MGILGFKWKRWVLREWCPQIPSEWYNEMLEDVMSYYHGKFPLYEKALIYSEMVHNYVNHRYDGKSYFKNHLIPTLKVAQRFQSYLAENELDTVFAAALLHDAIEDARVTYNDIKKLFGVKVADIVYAVTNEKGRSRTERANDKYYAGIKRNKLAVFVKLCDRVANVEHSSKTKSTMYKKYYFENENFIEKLYIAELNSFFDYIKRNLWQ